MSEQQNDHALAGECWENPLVDYVSQTREAVSEPTLLPCPLPWCGSTNVSIDRATWNELRMVVCGDCGTRGPVATVDDHAAHAWNRNRTDPATLALARLGAAVSKHGRLTRDGWGLVEDARDIPNIDARIEELLREEK